MFENSIIFLIFRKKIVLTLYLYHICTNEENGSQHDGVDKARVKNIRDLPETF